jgi:hypothetical protein
MRSESTDARAYAKRLGCLTVLVGSLVWAGTAPAQTPPPPEDVPAVSAYVELVPTSGGSRSPRVGPKGSAKLPAEVEAQLRREGGADTELLREVATSREYGAPPSSRGTPAPAPRDPPDEESPLAAGVGVATDGSNERVAVLGLLLIAMTLGALGAAVYQRRRTSA